MSDDDPLFDARREYETLFDMIDAVLAEHPEFDEDAAYEFITDPAYRHHAIREARHDRTL